LREDRGEIQAALDGTLPNLITLDDIRSDLQMHTDASDGKSTLQEMAEACRELGYTHIGITDHSETLRVANGLDADRLKAQHERIQALNEKLAKKKPKLTILHGIEADILTDGTLDIPGGTFELLDYVVAAIHQGFSDDAEKMTQRVVNAIGSGMVDILAHPTGRILLQRRPYGLNIHEVIEAAAEHDVALEINASPQRLDLDDVDSRSAVKAGCKLSINTDSHSTGMLGNMRYGVTQARRGWVEAESVINTWSLSNLRKWLKTRR
jgi:DNA polymerase (family 10)